MPENPMSEKLDIFQILLESGFVVQAVLLILVVGSALSWAIILQKRKVFERTENENKEFEEFFRGGRALAEIFERANEKHYSTLGQMFKSGYVELMKIKEKLKSA